MGMGVFDASPLRRRGGRARGVARRGVAEKTRRRYVERRGRTWRRTRRSNRHTKAAACCFEFFPLPPDVNIVSLLLSYLQVSRSVSVVH